MILKCTYEEVRALEVGARALLGQGPDSDVGTAAGLAVASPPATRAKVEAILPRLGGLLTIRTLADQTRVEVAVEAIVSHLGQEMEGLVLATHPADESAVASYFDYAHALAVLGRLREMRAEMEALVEVLIGTHPDDYLAQNFVFPD